MGLSASPVLGIVITGTISVIVGLVGALAGLQRLQPSSAAADEAEDAEARPSKPLLIVLSEYWTPIVASNSVKAAQAAPAHTPDPSVTFAPLAILLVSIVVGSTVGLFVRTNDLLGPVPAIVTWKWSRSGLPRAEIARRLLDTVYSEATKRKDHDKDDSDSGKSGGSSGTPSVLYHVIPPEDCVSLKSVSGPDLRRFMKKHPSKHIQDFEKNCPDDAILRIAVEELLCPDPDPVRSQSTP